MPTFIGQLIGFALIVLLVWRYVVPPVRGLMTARQETVRQQLKDSLEAAQRLTESTTAHSKAVEAAALADDGVKRALDGKAPKKVIVVPNRIVNIVA